MQYFFILGNSPTLSVAEIISVLSDQASEFHLRELSDNFLILETKEKLDALALQEKLGGTIKIGAIINEAKNFKPETAVKILEKFHRPRFGFSLYKLNKKLEIGNWKLEIKELALKIKRELREGSISSRWVISKEKILSSVIVQKNKLLTEGAEFCFLFGTRISADQNADQRRYISENQRSNQRISAYVGRTMSCQQFEEYSRRDFGRPARNIEEGMLPPKLAKIMINLSQAPEDGVILDPFCGSGTIIQEATRLGYRHVTGSDISKKAIDNTKVNLKWLAENFQFSISNFQINHNVQIFQSDVRNLSQKIDLTSIDAIITEPYLGPVKILNLKSEISNLVSELSDLYLKAFSEFKKILKPTGKVVIILPIFSKNLSEKRKIFSQKIGHLAESANWAEKADNIILSQFILPSLKKSGWQIVNPIPPELRKNPIIKITERNSIIYSRPDQMVLREIFIFIRNS